MVIHRRPRMVPRSYRRGYVRISPEESERIDRENKLKPDDMVVIACKKCGRNYEEVWHRVKKFRARKAYYLRCKTCKRDDKRVKSNRRRPPKR